MSAQPHSLDDNPNSPKRLQEFPFPLHVDRQPVPRRLCTITKRVPSILHIAFLPTTRREALGLLLLLLLHDPPAPIAGQPAPEQVGRVCAVHARRMAVGEFGHPRHRSARLVLLVRGRTGAEQAKKVGHGGFAHARLGCGRGERKRRWTLAPDGGQDEEPMNVDKLDEHRVVAKKKKKKKTRTFVATGVGMRRFERDGPCLEAWRDGRRVVGRGGRRPCRGTI